MTGFYGKQKMLRKLNNKLEMNNQQQKVVELDDLVRAYQDKVALSEEGFYADCDEEGDCPLMADEGVLARMEEILAEAYEAQEEQGEYDPWTGTRDFLEWGDAREDAYYDELEQDELYQQLEDELSYKERELALARRTAQRERQRRERIESGASSYPFEDDYNEASGAARHNKNEPVSITQRLQPQAQQHYLQQPTRQQPQRQAPQASSHYRAPAPQTHQKAIYENYEDTTSLPVRQPQPDSMYINIERQQPQLSHGATYPPLDRRDSTYPQSQEAHQSGQRTPAYSAPREEVDLNAFERYADSLRLKDWDELQQEREVRKAREQHTLFPGGGHHHYQQRQQQPQPKLPQQNQRQKAAINTAVDQDDSLLIDITNDEYGQWTDPPFLPESSPVHHRHGQAAYTKPSQTSDAATPPTLPLTPSKKKKGALKWLDPDWSIVRWVKDIFSDEDEEDEVHQAAVDHHHHTNGFFQHGVPSSELPQSVANEKQPAHAIIISSIFACLVTLFGLYLCLKVMLPKNRFERNSNITVFYLAAFSYLFVSMIPVNNDDSEVVFKFHKLWEHHPTSVMGVCTEIFRLAVLVFHFTGMTNVFLLTLNRNFNDYEPVVQWATFLREFNTVGSYICLALLIPLRQDFDWFMSLPLVYLVGLLYLVIIKPDSKVEILLNVLVLCLAYCQLTTLFILAVFVLNFKVFQFGYRKTKYIKTSEAHSIAWAKSEFQDATSYLNSTLECTTDGDAYVTERAIKREIRSYGLISILEEKVEYVGSSGEASFVLFDASGTERGSKSGELPLTVESSELGNKSKSRSKSIKEQAAERDVLSDTHNQQYGGGRPSRGRDSVQDSEALFDRKRSKSPQRGLAATDNRNNYHQFKSTQVPHVSPLGANNTLSSLQSSTMPPNSSNKDSINFGRGPQTESPQRQQVRQSQVARHQKEHTMASQSFGSAYEPPMLEDTNDGRHQQASRPRESRARVNLVDPVIQRRPDQEENGQPQRHTERQQIEISHTQQRPTQHLQKPQRSPLLRPSPANGRVLDETRYHSQVEDYRSSGGNNPGAYHHSGGVTNNDEDLFYDCNGTSTSALGGQGRGTPNLGGVFMDDSISQDTSGILLQMPHTPTQASHHFTDFRGQQHPQRVRQQPLGGRQASPRDLDEPHRGNPFGFQSQ